MDKKKEIAKKMGSTKSSQKKHSKDCCGNHSSHNGLGCCSEGKEGNYKKHLDKAYKAEDNFSTRKGE